MYFPRIAQFYTGMEISSRFFWLILVVVLFFEWVLTKWFFVLTDNWLWCVTIHNFTTDDLDNAFNRPNSDCNRNFDRFIASQTITRCTGSGILIASTSIIYWFQGAWFFLRTNTHSTNQEVLCFLLVSKNSLWCLL